MTSEKNKFGTPWEADGDGDLRDCEGDRFTEIWSDDYAGRAAYIARAVNNHEALVKLAKEVLICVRDEDDIFDLKYEARKILASLEK